MKHEKAPPTVIGKDYWNQKFYNQKEAAEKMSVDDKTVERLRKRGVLHFHQEGGVIRISEQQINDYWQWTLKNQTLTWVTTDWSNLSDVEIAVMEAELDPARTW